MVRRDPAATAGGPGRGPHLADLISRSGFDHNNDITIDMINQVFAYKKHDADFRMKGIYTYDIRENP